MILASRGLLDKHIPKEFTGLLTHLKIIGVDLEIEADFYKIFINLHTTQKNDKGLDETRKALFKLYYPDMKDDSESLMEEMQKRIINDPNKTMRIGAKTDKKLDPAAANRLLNKS